MINPLLLEVLNIQSESRKCDKMIDFVLEKCFEFGCTMIDYDVAGNVYAVKGEADTYPCIVAHMDTVHNILPDDQYRVISDDDLAFAYNPVKMQMTGVGGDDKVGIYIALQMIRDLDYCKVAFFVDEEIGCVGSMQADMTFFSDVRFVLQCDRKGNDDFVYNIMNTNLYDSNFSSAISPIIGSYGYKESTGGLTDVYQLAENGVGVAVANMSCGYYNPHTDEEMISLADVENCRRMVYDIMTICTDVYECKHEKTYYDTWWKDGGNGVSYKSKEPKVFHDGADWYDDKDWSNWEYSGGKYTYKKESKWTACWDCYGVFEKEDIDAHGLCPNCSEYHKEKIV